MKPDEDTTNRLLKAMIAVLLRTRDHQMPLKQQIAMLNGVGLRPSEIAEILGKTSTHVNKELSGLRRGKAKD